jgi:hypothetical protein
MAWPTIEFVFLLVGFVAVQPSKSFSEAAFAFGQWGNGGWAFGSIYNQRTQSEAQIAAMKACNQRGYNCAIRGNFRKTCFALAVQDTNNGWHTGVHDSPAVANQQALTGCTRMGLSCTIRESFCDTVSEAENLAAEQAEYQQYVQNWKGCFGQVVVSSSNEQINFCDYALRFPRAIQSDRTELLKQKTALITARNQELANKAQAALDEERTEEDFHMYELRWKYCFDSSVPLSRLDGQITSCNYALAYPGATPGDRSKLLEQREALWLSRDYLAQGNSREQTPGSKGKTSRRLHAAAGAHGRSRYEWTSSTRNYFGSRESTSS